MLFYCEKQSKDVKCTGVENLARGLNFTPSTHTIQRIMISETNKTQDRQTQRIKEKK